MLRNRLIAVLPVVLCSAGILAAASGSTPAGAATASPARAAKKTCDVKAVVKGSAGETHARVTFDFNAGDEGGGTEAPDAKLPVTISSGHLSCADVSGTVSAHNHASGLGDTYVYLYLNGHLDGDGFGAGDGSSARATFQDS